MRALIVVRDDDLGRNPFFQSEIRREVGVVGLAVRVLMALVQTGLYKAAIKIPTTDALIPARAD